MKEAPNVSKEVIMRNFSINEVLKVLVLSIILTGCAAYVSPEGTYLEPYPTSVVVGPPVVVAPSPNIFVRPLPPVFYYPDRPSMYYYNNTYYYRYGRDWYYGEHDRGPWHKLPKEYHPRQEKRYEGDHERERDRDRD